MRTAATTLRTVSREKVAAAVADFLGIEPGSIDARTPLTAYGIDSLGALQLVARLEDRFGCTLPESLLADCPDVHRLAHALGEAGANDEDNEDTAAAATAQDRLLSDSRLPDDILPQLAGPRMSQTGQVLLTGATGFLGTSLLRSLIDSGFNVVCLVRSRGDGASARVRASLERYGLWRATDAARFTAVVGDLEQPRLGLSQKLYDRLAGEVGAVYHAAADVSWVAAYEALRSSNVSATIDLLRFACSRTLKPFHFVSSLSVCLAHNGPSGVDERTDMLAYVDALPLGYAQSKCVAESLVRAAAARGLPAQIYRPALLAGHSASGASNVDDFIAALLKGCIQLGAAPDLDWVFDAVPVDAAAASIVRLSRSCAPRLETFHLRHPRPRHWRECVLWANFFGYPVRLEPYARWLERLGREARTPDHALYRLRGFFTRRVAGRTVPEHYEEHARSRVDCTRTHARERLAGVDYPALDAGRLDSYLTDLVARGFITPPRRHRRASSTPTPGAEWPAQCEPLLRRYFSDRRLRVTRAELVQRGSEHSIISELTAWKRGGRTGLFRYRLTVERGGAAESLNVMVKIKPPDEDAIEVAETAAAIVDGDVSRELARFRDLIGIRGSHIRELEIYRRQTDARFGRHMPACYGMWTDEAGESWGLLLEHLDGMAVMNAQSPAAWSDTYRGAAIDGLAAIHSAWLGRERDLVSQPWIGHVASAASAVEMTPLWTALARHAAPAFQAWAGSSLVGAHAELAASVGRWWPALEALPRTLIHNDFNPRNIAIRRAAGPPRLVAYDWELATIGAPQRDLAEFLCFTLPESVDGHTLDRWIERHRFQLEGQSGMHLAEELWRDGFRSALADVLVSRLAFYALIHRVRPLSFLPRVVRTWSRLYELMAEAGTRAGHGRGEAGRRLA